ncbi:MAG: GNAT family N-acetyltransferase [Nitriliruptorales bacterium]|nr:GNAT family N-acetyltransferase [Nitriliruptorales bacterium]
MPLLYGTTVTLRPVTAEDVGRLEEILRQPEVGHWLPHYEPGQAQREFAGTPGFGAFAIDVQAQLIGGAQYYEEPARDYRHATIDVFLDYAWHGKGLGADTVRTLARHLLYDKGHHRLSISLNAGNDKAVRTYQRVGFRPVGLMRQCERGPDGEWRDAMLLELLKRDLQ